MDKHEWFQEDFHWISPLITPALHTSHLIAGRETVSLYVKQRSLAMSLTLSLADSLSRHLDMCGEVAVSNTTHCLFKAGTHWEKS